MLLKTFMILSSMIAPAYAIEQGIETSMEQEIHSALIQYYGVDQITAGHIQLKLAPFIDDSQHHGALKEFIEKSQELILSTRVSEPSLEIQEANEKYPLCHKVLFENEHVRIVSAHTASGMREPLQVHPYKSFMFVIEPAPFESRSEDGSSFEDNWPRGLYILDPWMSPSACKNIGLSDYYGLVFEIKN